jgi:hypothetical protein
MRIDGEYENGDGWMASLIAHSVPDGTYREDTDSKTGEKAQVANFKVEYPPPCAVSWGGVVATLTVYAEDSVICL